MRQQLFYCIEQLYIIISITKLSGKVKEEVGKSELELKILINLYILHTSGKIK